MATVLPDALRPLDADDAATAFSRILDGAVDDAEIARFLLALADRGETVDEIVAAARAMRARCLTPFEAADAIDVCGTGGDGLHSLNISTAVALVVAACGVRVAKHGNRSASSKSGAADVLAELGVPELPLERLGACLDSIGITFLHAARHHPVMARVAPVRRALGRRTIFNLLGPLANPAGVRRQLVGVYAPHWVEPLAQALHRLGSSSAMVAHGDGFDEIAVSAPSIVASVRDAQVSVTGIAPTIAGGGEHPASALAGGDPRHNADALRALLAGAKGAYHDIVVVNSAAALRVADPALGWMAAGDKARAALESGAALALLTKWSKFR